jgi:hypothetical protein
MQYNDKSHSPTSFESRLIDKLLSIEFDGSADLKAQAASATVRWVRSDGAPALLIEPEENARPADVGARVPVEASGRDVDGVVIHFLLHVVDRRVREVEIYREDGGPLQEMPDVESLQISTN